MVTLTEEEQRILDAAIAEGIPQNDNRVVQHNETSRFSGAIWYQQIKKQEITLAGVGGIGSYLGLLLGRLEPNMLAIYDPDVVEPANMSGQMYGFEDVDKYKVDALYEIIRRYTTTNNVYTFSRAIDHTDTVRPICICGFDNMEARKLLYTLWKQQLPTFEEPALFIDGRLNAEEFQIFCIQGYDTKAMEEYEQKWLFTDAESDESICSYKQTTFCANMIATFMVNYFVNFIANQCGPIINRSVPFFTHYDATLGLFKTVEPWQL